MGGYILKAVIKKIMCAFSWICFAVMLTASIVAVLSTALGVGATVVSWFTDMDSIIMLYANMFFYSILAITTVSIIFAVYEYLINIYHDRKLKKRGWN
jgi:hypothetical protein